jgi:putative transposase
MTAERTAGNATRKERLRRLERIFPTERIYFVTACVAQRRSILANSSMHRSFLEFASTGADRGAFIGAYILMPDHLHLFVALDDRMLLSTWMKSLKNALSKTLRSAGIASPHWQKGFFDHVLRSKESYSQQWQYVWDNPVRAGLANDCRPWPFLGEIHPLELRAEDRRS